MSTQRRNRMSVGGIFEDARNNSMPTLVIDNVPAALYEQIQRVANSQHRTPADTVLEVLETAFCSTTPIFCEAPLPQQPFVAEEISSPYSLPRPEGRPVRPMRVAAPLPTAHDLQEQE